MCTASGPCVFAADHGNKSYATQQECLVPHPPQTYSHTRKLSALTVTDGRGYIRSTIGRFWDPGRTRTKRKQHKEKILAILDALQSAENVEFAMLSWRNKLNPREEAIILSEQQDLKLAMELFSWFRRCENYTANVFRYNIMFKIIGKHRNWGLLKEMWHSMLQDNVCPTNVTYSTIINAYTKAGLKVEALRWFEQMSTDKVEPDEVTLSTMFNLYKLAGEYVEAESFCKKFLFDLENVRGIRPQKIDTFNTLIDLYGKAGRLTDASRVFEYMISSGLKPDTVSFNTLMQICGSNNRLSEAEALFKKMVSFGCESDIGTYNILISMYVKAGNLQSARETLVSLRRSQVSPNLVSYRTLFLGYCSNSLVNEVENLLSEMEEAGFFPDVTLLVQYIQMFIRVGDHQKASEQFCRLKLCGGLTSENIFPLIDSYAELGLWKKAEEIFLASAELGLQKSTLPYNAMIKAYGLGKKYWKAFDLFDTMKNEGIAADEATFNTMIHAASARGALRRAVALLSEMKATGFRPSCSSYTAVLSLFSKLRQVKEAENLFHEMKTFHSHVDEVAYAAIIDAYAEAGMQKEAEATLTEMEIAGHTASSIVYCSLMKLYGKLDMLQKAEELVKKIERIEVQPNVHAWNVLLHIYGRMGMTDTAWVTFKKMQKGGYFNKASCKAIISTLKKAGRVQDALSVADSMRELGLFFGTSSFNVVLDLYVSSEKHYQALDLFKQMIKQGCWPNLRTYFCLKDVLENSTLLREAVGKLKSPVERRDHVHHLIAMATLYCFAGMQTEAIETCTKIKESGVVLDITAYNTILYVYGTNGQFEEAVRLFMELQTNGPVPNVVTFTTMLLLYGKAGLVEGVTRLFNRMKQAECRPDEACFKVVIDIYKRAGRFDLASMATHEMQFMKFLKERSHSMLGDKGETEIVEDDSVQIET